MIASPVGGLKPGLRLRLRLANRMTEAISILSATKKKVGFLFNKTRY